jgi:hypothetical protein
VSICLHIIYETLIDITENLADAKILRKTEGFQGKILVAVLPECISGRNPSEIEREILRTGSDPVASWPVMFSSKERLEPHNVLRRGDLAIEKIKPDTSEFGTEWNVIPDIDNKYTPVLTSSYSFSTLQQWFTCVRLPETHLTEFYAQHFP